MFTGIIESCVRVIRRTDSSLVIERPQSFAELVHGQSIACNGACLSVTEYTNDTVSFDVLSETFRKTNLGECEMVNVERALAADGRFEGHVVLGHVDETIQFLSDYQELSGWEYRFSLPQQQRYLVEKGSVSLNGISLTIGKIADDYFSVYLIPITLEKTNMGTLTTGDTVCLEYDYLGKLLLAHR